MNALLLLCLITLCYAAYNLFVKVSSGHVPADTAPILATISLQIAALTVSLIYLFYLYRSQIGFSVSSKVYLWAIIAGVCIGLAEVMYFYLFRGVGGGKAMNASVAVPFIVGGTIAIVAVVSHFIFREALGMGQWIGIGFAFAGMIILALTSSS